MILSFLVQGQPIPWARAGGNGSRRFNDPKAQAYKELVRLHALKARNTLQRTMGPWPLDGIYSLTCVVRRKDWTRIDADRILNQVADACVGVLFEDDRHRFLRDARVLIGDPIHSPYLGVVVRVMKESEHREEVEAVEELIAHKEAK